MPDKLNNKSNNKPIIIVLTGGGTGGHISIILELAKEIFKEDKNYKLIYIGSLNGREYKEYKDIFNSNIFHQTYFLDSIGIAKKNPKDFLKGLYKLSKAILTATNILEDERVKAVFSVGGYSAAPASLSSIFKNIPLFIHEQNSKAGLLNKLLFSSAKKVFLSFGIAKKDNEIKVPYPINQEYFKNSRVRKNLNNIIFLGGSQGAVSINNLALKITPKLPHIHIMHQSGLKDFSRVKSEYEKLGLNNVDIFPFDLNLRERLNKADLAISRAGASTLWELCALQLPSILIPYPHANKHQYFNAMEFKETSKVIEVINEEDILNDILTINIEQASIKLKDKLQPNGASIIAQTIQQFINNA